MTIRDPIGFGKPPFSLPKAQPPKASLWDWPLTPAVLCALAFAVAFVAFIAMAWGFA